MAHLLLALQLLLADTGELDCVSMLKIGKVYTSSLHSIVYICVMWGKGAFLRLARFKLEFHIHRKRRWLYCCHILPELQRVLGLWTSLAWCMFPMAVPSLQCLLFDNSLLISPTNGQY